MEGSSLVHGASWHDAGVMRHPHQLNGPQPFFPKDFLVLPTPSSSLSSLPLVDQTPKFLPLSQCLANHVELRLGKRS